MVPRPQERNPPSLRLVAPSFQHFSRIAPHPIPLHPLPDRITSRPPSTLSPLFCALGFTCRVCSDRWCLVLSFSSSLPFHYYYTPPSSPHRNPPCERSATAYCSRQHGFAVSHRHCHHQSFLSYCHLGRPLATYWQAAFSFSPLPPCRARLESANHSVHRNTRFVSPIAI